MKKNLLNFIVFALTFTIYAQIPTYYNDIDFNQTGDALKYQLTTLISDTHTNLIPYTSSDTDTWDILKQSDLETNNTEDVLLIYGYNDVDGDNLTDRIREKTLSCHSNSCIGLWNREHVFPKSLANPSLDTSYPSSGTDAHNLKPCDSQRNSSRSNRLFAEGTDNSHITAQGHYYPGDEWKGDIARIIMYMYLRYPSQCLANSVAESQNNFNMDMPDIFLEWNAQDPVSGLETQRNNVIASHQGNRNPFIDNPYLATIIWGGVQASNTWDILSVVDLDNKTLSIYPNPVTSTLYIDNALQVDIKATIFSLDNKTIEVNSYNNTQLDVSNLSNGIYFLKLIQYNKTSVIRFIKN